MECQSSDSPKLFKVFDASKRNRGRKKHEGLDDSNSLATDDSTSGCQATVRRVSSAKASLQDVPTAQTVAVTADNGDAKRDRDSSPSVSRSPRGDSHRSTRSPRRHRRTARDGVSLALKAGLVSTPRSVSPPQEADGVIDSIPQDQDSFIYAFLEEALKRDKKRQRDRHSRRHEDRRLSHEHDVSVAREHRHHHRRHREDIPSKERERPKKEEVVAPAIDQTALFETFAKICAQLNEKTAACPSPVARTLSHKSLQCEVESRRDSYDVDRHPMRLRSHEQSRENVSKARSQENCRGRVYSHERIPANLRGDKEKCSCYYDKDIAKYSSKLNVTRSKMRAVDDDRYPDYPPENMIPRNHLEHGYRPRLTDNRDYRDYDRDFAREKHYEADKKRYYDQKTSRSFEVQRDGYPEDEKYCRRTARSDNNKEKNFDERDKYYDEKHSDPRDRYLPSKDRRVKRNLDRFERNSVASREDDYRDRDRDRYSERERDSGLSVADGENSTISGKSNYLRVVKQEIAEQREAMDKMMKLWKELMRCFKGMSAQGQNKTVHESAANVQESAAAQLRLWRECMRRYETVARDVGDTDARLMEEINKQRSEMSEMASMWQECLQRYREMSSDFNNLKQQVTVTKQQFVPPESPTRLPAAPITCAEGEGTIPPVPYRLPPNYPQVPPQMGGLPPGYAGGSPLRSRASAPPAWWWCGEGPRESPRRRSSPESRGSRDRDRDRRHRHKDRDRDDSRYKEKSSKPSAARSEHRHRKR